MAANPPTPTPVEGLVERMVRAAYDDLPCRAVSPALAEMFRLEIGDVIPFDAIEQAGGDHNGLRRIVRAALAALKPTGERGELVDALLSAVRIEREYGEGPHTDLMDAAAARITADAALIEAKDAEIARRIEEAYRLAIAFAEHKAKLAEARAELEKVPISAMVGKCGWKSWEEARDGLHSILATLDGTDEPIREGEWLPPGVELEPIPEAVEEQRLRRYGPSCGPGDIPPSARALAEANLRPRQPVPGEYGPRDEPEPPAEPRTIWVQLSDCGQHIRRWSREPFEGGAEYRLWLLGPGASA